MKAKYLLWTLTALVLALGLSCGDGAGSASAPNELGDAKSITITGLPPQAIGTYLGIGVLRREGNTPIQIARGGGIVESDSHTMDLFPWEDDSFSEPWTGSGGYYFQIGFWIDPNDAWVEEDPDHAFIYTAGHEYSQANLDLFEYNISQANTTLSFSMFREMTEGSGNGGPYTNRINITGIDDSNLEGRSVSVAIFYSPDDLEVQEPVPNVTNTGNPIISSGVLAVTLTHGLHGNYFMVLRLNDNPFETFLYTGDGSDTPAQPVDIIAPETNTPVNIPFSGFFQVQ